MLKTNILIQNKLGLHARASAKLCKLAATFPCEVFMTHKERRVNAKSIMGVMLLAAGQGTTVIVRADGEDEAAAMDAVVALFERRFDEES